MPTQMMITCMWSHGSIAKMVQRQDGISNQSISICVSAKKQMLASIEQLIEPVPVYSSIHNLYYMYTVLVKKKVAKHTRTLREGS